MHMTKVSKQKPFWNLVADVLSALVTTHRYFLTLAAHLYAEISSVHMAFWAIYPINFENCTMTT